MTSPLSYRIQRAREVDLETLQCLHRLRLAQFPFREPSTQKESAMWREFQHSYRQNHAWSVVFYDGKGVPRGFWLAVSEKTRAPARKGMLLRVDYSYTDPGWRGSSALIVSTLAVLLRVKLQAPLLPLLFGCICFPNSFVRVAATFRGVRTLADSTLAAADKALLEQLGADAAGARWQAAAGLADFSDHHPPALARSIADTPRLARHLSRYEAANPAWRQGLSMPIFCEIGLATASQGIWHSLRRVLRRKRKRR
ncbi:hypothetical protein [Chromobacterium sp. IIBBL 290-4]|uniref:hypothetical protein n=1 Tax=Chromobacterium sp. IIBBL 290-4 TaxID=2953890 RepID=UPI0020B670BF|nr:hypothetical protein [Chromobacterium sp. IIBBL 290-4]UTH75307.1 hypothetical protein NKT35_04180 [Chromobacterium sp. IIBBL 290-4]